MPMQYIEFSEATKIERKKNENFDIFLVFTKKIDCGYLLEPPRYEYTQSMFWIRKMYTPAHQHLLFGSWV